MDEFVKGADYAWTKIHDFCEKKSLEMNEYGDEIVGQHFICVIDDNTTTSFVLTGTSGVGYIYTCIYNE